MATARFGMTLNEVTTSLLNRNANEANNFQLIDNLAMMLTKNNVLGDGIYIATDKIRARDADGLCLQDSAGNGITIQSGGGMAFSGGTGDKISLYLDKLGESDGYCIGVETSYTYMKSNGGYRWYSRANADGGVSDIMELSSAGVLSLSGLRAIDGDGLDLLDNAGDGIHIVSRGWAGFGAASPVGRVHVEGSDHTNSAIVQLRTSGPYQWNRIINAAGGMLLRYGNISTGDDLVVISNTGAVGVGTVTQAAKLAVNGGVNVGADSDPGDNNLYVVGDCSALTFTDRTPAFVGDALAAIKAIQDDGNGHIDHATLPEFARRSYRKPIFEEVEVQKKVPILDGKGKEIIDEITGEVVTETITETVIKSDRYEEAPGRDIGAMLSVLTTAAQQLLAENEALKVRVENLEKAQVAKA